MWFIKTTINFFQVFLQFVFRLFWTSTKSYKRMTESIAPDQEQPHSQEVPREFGADTLDNKIPSIQVRLCSEIRLPASPKAMSSSQITNQPASMIDQGESVASPKERTEKTKPRLRTFFRVRRVLGTGQWGVVFHLTRQGTVEAQQTPNLDLGLFSLSIDSTELEHLREWPLKDFALKVMRKRGIMQSEAGPRHTSNERMLSDSLLNPTSNDNPFIIKMLASFQTPQKVCFLMEHCEGGDLYYLMDHKKWFAEEWCLFYMAEVLDAIHYLHKLRICYSDLKPENVCIAKDGHVKLVDFGLSCQMGWNVRRRSSFVGTKEYMSPEIYSGKGHSFPTDIWSLGAMGFELFYCYLPVKKGDYYNVRFLPRPDDVCPSEEFVDFMLNCLHPEEERRWTAKELLGHGFFKLRFHDWSVVSSKSLIPPYIPERDGLVGQLVSIEHQMNSLVTPDHLRDRWRDKVREDQDLRCFGLFRDVDAKFDFPGCDEPMVEEEVPEDDESTSNQQSDLIERKATVEDSDDDLEGAITFTVPPKMTNS